MRKDFQESKNYDDLLAYRFERFDIELTNFLIKKTTRFFEFFIEGYLSYENYSSSAKKFNSEMVKDYQATKKDLFEISTSGLGIFYFSVLDEVIINRMIQLGEYNFKEIKDIADKSITIIDLFISDIYFDAHELYFHDNLSNRLDHLNKLSIIREKNTSDIFSGSEYIIRYAHDSDISGIVDTSVNLLLDYRIESAVLTHVILSWIWYGHTVEEFHLGIIKHSSDLAAEKRQKLDSTPPYVKLLVKFGIVYVVLYYLLHFLNIHDEFHWLLSITLLVILYGVLTIKSKNSSPGGGIEKILYHELLFTLNSQSYHPDTIKNKLNYIENKGVVVPQSMYSVIKIPSEKNTLIYRSDNIKYIYKNGESDEPLFAKSRDHRSFKNRIYELGEITVMRKDDKIEFKQSDSDTTHELEVLHVELDMTIKPMGNYWKVETDYDDEKNNPEVQGLNCQLENISIGHKGDEGWSSSLQNDSVFVIYKEKLILPRNFLVGIQEDSQFRSNMKRFYGVDIDEFTKLEDSVKEPQPIGMIYFNYFVYKDIFNDGSDDSINSDSPDGEMYIHIGLKDEIYEKVLNHTYKGGVENITFNTDCWAYTSSFEYGSSRDLILDQSVMSERRHGEKRNISKTVLIISDLTVNFSN